MLDASHLYLLVYKIFIVYKWRKNTIFFVFRSLKTFNTPLIQCFLGVYLLLNFFFYYSGYRAFYFAVQYFIYIHTYFLNVYIYSGRFAAWITYSLITPQYALCFAYILKYRNFQFYLLSIYTYPYYIYVCWALRTLYYLLMCYIPLSCFL